MPFAVFIGSIVAIATVVTEHQAPRPPFQVASTPHAYLTRHPTTGTKAKDSLPVATDAVIAAVRGVLQDCTLRKHAATVDPTRWMLSVRHRS